jgi:hypothetical protein
MMQDLGYVEDSRQKRREKITDGIGIDSSTKHKQARG